MMTAPAHAISGWKGGWYVVPHEVTFRDADYFGHVNNAVYFTYFEMARTKFWFEMNDSKLPGDIGFIVARAECDFRKQISITEAIEIGVRVAEMGNSSIEFVYEIRNHAGEVAATGKVVVVLFDWKTHSKQPISDTLRQRVLAFQQASQPV